MPPITSSAGRREKSRPVRARRIWRFWIEIEERQDEREREGGVAEDRERHVQGEERPLRLRARRRRRRGQQHREEREEDHEGNQERTDRALAMAEPEKEVRDAEHPAEEGERARRACGTARNASHGLAREGPRTAARAPRRGRPGPRLEPARRRARRSQGLLPRRREKRRASRGIGRPWRVASLTVVGRRVTAGPIGRRSSALRPLSCWPRSRSRCRRRLRAEARPDRGSCSR